MYTCIYKYIHICVCVYRCILKKYACRFLNSRAALCFPTFCGARGLKSRLAKAVGAEPSGQMRDEKLHVVVARCAFRSQNGKRT